MARQHEIALAHPCYLAGETIHGRFASVTPFTSTVLTINAGYE